jgi:hypothetical protein
MADRNYRPPDQRMERPRSVPRSVKVLLAIAGAIVAGIVVLDLIAILGHF